MQEFDQRDRELLHVLQSDLPLASTPYAIVGQIIDMSEKEVIKRISRLKQSGVISQIRAVFDGRSLAYRTSLVAATIDEKRIDEAAAIINGYPGVSQNYQRNHEYNLWFTISVPPTSRVGLERTVAILGEEAGCEVVHALPARKIFRANDDRDPSMIDDPTEEPEAGGSSAPSPEEQVSIRALQEDLPLQPRPFETLARQYDLEPETLLETAKKLQSQQRLRRFAAIVQARKSSFSTSALGIWIVDEDKADEIATQMLSHRGISQCSLRETTDQWPYNLFSVVHGRTVDECESLLQQIARETNIEQMQVLFPVKEFKKARVTFFSPDFESWESEHHAETSASAAS